MSQKEPTPLTRSERLTEFKRRYGSNYFRVPGRGTYAGYPVFNEDNEAAWDKLIERADRGDYSGVLPVNQQSGKSYWELSAVDTARTTKSTLAIDSYSTFDAETEQSDVRGREISMEERTLYKRVIENMQEYGRKYPERAGAYALEMAYRLYDDPLYLKPPTPEERAAARKTTQMLSDFSRKHDIKIVSPRAAETEEWFKKEIADMQQNRDRNILDYSHIWRSDRPVDVADLMITLVPPKPPEGSVLQLKVLKKRKP